MSKKRILVGLTFLAVLCVFTGCQQNPEAIIFSKETATKTNLIKFNTKNATYLATQWASEVTENRSASREGEAASSTEETVNSTQSLVAVVGDEVKDVLELPKDELKLCDWCVPQPVREVYKCPYPTIEYEAKGFYTVFAGYIDWWWYDNGTKAPNVGQIFYVKPDGTVLDILNFENDVRRYATTWIKENDGEDYIQFDNNGNIFILTKDDSVGKTVVYRYNPLNDKVDGYTLDVNGDVDIRNFRVTRDGKWIFLNVMLRHRENNVYALQVNSTAKPIPMYEFDGELPETGQDPQWAVSSIEINPTTNEVYWYVDTYLDDTRAGAGLYVASRSTNGEYSKKRVKRYYPTPKWCLDNAVRKYITDIGSKERDYESLLYYLKEMCRSTTINPQEDVVFTLEYFKDCWRETRDWNGNYKEKDFSPLYAEDAQGKPLTDVAALKYMFETTLNDYYEVDDNRYGDDTLFNLFCWYFDDYWHEPEYDDDGILRNGNKGYLTEGNYKSGNVFPWEYFLKNKKTGEPAIDVNYSMGYFAERVGGYILANDEGMWVMNDIWDDAAHANTHSNIFNLTDEKGNFTYDQPGDILSMNAAEIFCSRESCRRLSDNDPWFKKPVSVNTTGIAALSVDKKTIYYHKEGVTRDLLAADPNKANISQIYSFNLEEDQIIYNAKTTSGTFIMVSIDLESGKATKLPLKSRVESMMGMWSDE